MGGKRTKLSIKDGEVLEQNHVGVGEHGNALAPNGVSTKLDEDTMPTKTPEKVEAMQKLFAYLLDRVDKLEEFGTSSYTKMVALTAKCDALEAKLEGKDLGFEKTLKSTKADPVILNKSQEDIYGTYAGVEIQDMVHKVLGLDCHAYVKGHGVLPMTQLSILVPERLSGRKFDFRTKNVQNASALADTKKWCEAIKSNLYKQYASETRGNPEFLIA